MQCLKVFTFDYLLIKLALLRNIKYCKSEYIYLVFSYHDIVTDIKRYNIQYKNNTYAAKYIRYPQISIPINKKLNKVIK